MTDKLHQAIEYEEKNVGKISAEDRPAFHVTGKIGWINDPNGFSTYKGDYHLFYQYHPYSTHWGPMHWGHVKSHDFIKWERLPVAIAPDQKYDGFGCFSGGAIELPDGQQLLMYTGVETRELPDGSKKEFQHQCIAIGDGITYEKYENNPVIAGDKLPQGGDVYDFRDPKIVKKGDNYFCYVGNRTEDGSGSVLVYQSKDAKNWSFTSVLDRSFNQYGRMWECPDLFELEGKSILAVSPQEMEAVGLEFHSGNNAIFVVGKCSEDNKLSREWVQSIDYGLDFYAPQTLETEDGRRVMIAWMQNWDTCSYRKGDTQFFGQMTLPRELSVRDGRIYQLPVREIENYHVEEVVHQNMLVDRETELDGISGRIFDMTLSVDQLHSDFEEFIIRLAKDEAHETRVVYNRKKSIICMDRRHSGVQTDVVCVREFKVNSKKDRIIFRIIMDKNSIELFVNEGEQAASMMIYTEMSADRITFESDGSALVDVKKNKIDLEKLV